ncbi:galactosylceramide sulfotransferase-like [Uloborus diversus]|uniref:galactosylceramide sulfotransferase-like n=1 Tax=Uloborus diversus TaxID=327109 RepID=UPI002409E835|nr:galactosylceramide sulfotransferase-like [Uloborus diversus]
MSVSIRHLHITHGTTFCLLAVISLFGFFISFQLILYSPKAAICYPKSNIVFLKTHKCAGSSIQNILMRYGDTRNLNFALPATTNYLGHPQLFDRSQIMQPRPPVFNILTHHTRLNFTEIKDIMPNNTIFITILRDPAKLFESLFYYYGFDLQFKSLRNFLKVGKQYEGKRFGGRIGFNQMMFDLGADPVIFDNETMVRQYLKKIETWFDLVLVADRMDESLAMLRQLLCWDFNDVVVFKVNARTKRFKSELSDEERKLLKQYNQADVILYNHFLNVFDRKVKEFGEDNMASEMTELKQKVKQWYDTCIDESKTSESVKAANNAYYNPRIELLRSKKEFNNETCDLLTRSELDYTEILRVKQKTKFNEKMKL